MICARLCLPFLQFFNNPFSRALRLLSLSLFFVVASYRPHTPPPPPGLLLLIHFVVHL